jgi:hypothetical protein
VNVAKLVMDLMENTTGRDVTVSRNSAGALPRGY